MQLWDENKDKNFLMFALSDESASEVEKIVTEYKPNYPIGSGADFRAYEVTGYPTAVLVDHKGEVIWRDNFLDASARALMEAALLEAEQFSPKWDPGERAAELGRAVEAARKGDMGKAWKEAQTLRAKAVENPSLLSAIEGFEADYLARAAIRTTRKDEMLTTGRYWEATLFLEAEIKVFAGAPPAEEWKQATLAWKKDKTAKANLDLDKKRLAALEKAKEDRDKALKELRSLRDKAAGLAVQKAIDTSYQQVAGV